MGSDLKVFRESGKILTLLLCMVITLTSVSFSAATVKAQESDDLVVGVYKDRCPIFYQDENTGEIIGIGADLIKIAAAEAGYNANLTVIKENNLKEALDNPEYDIILPFGSAVQSESGRASVVSEKLFETPFTLVTTNKQTLPHIEDAKVGMLSSLGGAVETIRGLYPGIEILLYDNMSDCVKALRKGEVDALLHNSYVWSYVLQKPAYSDLVVHPSAMFAMDFRVGALDDAKGREIIERLNTGIGKITDTKRQAIVLDYTTRSLYRYDIWDYLHMYGLFIALLVLLMIAAAVIIVMKQHALVNEHKETMRRMIDYDPLTGVFSAYGFKKKVEELLREHPDIPYVLSFNNIQDFKFINDSCGWAAGNEFLKFWADTTKEYLTSEEAMGRLDGDHFVVLRRIGGKEQIDRDDKNVFQPLRNYFIDRGKNIKVRITTGLYVLMPYDYQNIDVEHMIDYARVAEKRINSDNKDGYQFYIATQWENSKRASDIISHLTAAIETGEIQVFYQPQVDYSTGKITGAEALCRWKHGTLGWVSPGEFIPVLEGAGLVYELDCAVWELVCRDLKRWNDQGIKRKISVNLSRCDIQKNKRIPEYFHDLISKYNITPDQLHIEITETAYVEDSELLISTTTRLKEYGFQVEMDDFGSGYSSLNMLKEVPVDKIKMDLKFLTETGNPKMRRVIITHMIQMVHALGMGIVAEGVETIEQADFLKNLGCNVMQGFYFYRPVPVAEFEKYFD